MPPLWLGTLRPTATELCKALDKSFALVDLPLGLVFVGRGPRFCGEKFVGVWMTNASFPRFFWAKNIGKLCAMGVTGDEFDIYVFR